MTWPILFEHDTPPIKYSFGYRSIKAELLTLYGRNKPVSVALLLSFSPFSETKSQDSSFVSNISVWEYTILCEDPPIDRAVIRGYGKNSAFAGLRWLAPTRAPFL